MRMKLHVPAISCLSKGAQISKSEKLWFVVGSPWHEKLTNTHPSRSVDTGVGVGSSADLGASSVDVGTGSGVDTGEGLDAGVVAVFCPKT